MADKYIIIDKNAATRTLQGYASEETTQLVLVIPSAKVADAMIELATIDDDYWCSSNNQVEREGDVNDSLVLPKKAIT